MPGWRYSRALTPAPLPSPPTLPHRERGEIPVSMLFLVFLPLLPGRWVEGWEKRAGVMRVLLHRPRRLLQPYHPDHSGQGEQHPDDLHGGEPVAEEDHAEGQAQHHRE